MNRERLTQMVTMLRALSEAPEVKFNLHDWHCGTSACAVGHACLNPVFMDQGLELTYWGAPRFDARSSWDAVTHFFEIDREAAGHLFSDDAYKTGGNTEPAAVADRIESFLAGAEA